MISASVPAQWDDLTGLEINGGVRERLHGQLDVWLDLLEEEMEGKEGEMDELVRAIFEARHELTGLVAESLVEKLHSKELEQTEMVCPKCGRALTARDEVERTVETMVGEVKLKRPYFWCKKCSEAKSEIDRLIGYLKENKDRVDYKFYRNGGYPVGSGGIESSNKTLRSIFDQTFFKSLCHVQLKRSDARWYVEKANQMLALRCAKYNGTFQKLFLQYMVKFRHT